MAVSIAKYGEDHAGDQGRQAKQRICPWKLHQALEGLAQDLQARGREATHSITIRASAIRSVGAIARHLMPPAVPAEASGRGRSPSRLDTMSPLRGNSTCRLPSSDRRNRTRVRWKAARRGRRLGVASPLHSARRGSLGEALRDFGVGAVSRLGGAVERSSEAASAADYHGRRIEPLCRKVEALRESQRWRRDLLASCSTRCSPWP